MTNEEMVGQMVYDPSTKEYYFRVYDPARDYTDYKLVTGGILIVKDKGNALIPRVPSDVKPETV